MKRVLALGLSLVLLLGLLTACGNDPSTEAPQESKAPEATVTEEKPSANPAVTTEAVTTEAATTEEATETEAATGEETEDAVKGLAEVYKDYFKVGTIYTKDVMGGKDAEVVLSNFNVITPENLMKPEATQPREGQFTMNNADLMVRWAQAYNLTVHGHCLAWHQQSGNWLGKTSDRDEAIAQLKAHVEGVAGHYEKDEIYSWDVLNEAINDGVSLPADGDWTKCLRNTQWLQSIGPEYVSMVFKFAREAAPNAILYYNDYNMNDANKAKIAAAMVKDLRSQGVPIDGIGMQGHYTTSTSLGSVQRSLELFSSIEGIKISVSELDVGVNGLRTGKPSEQQLTAQAVFYANLFLLYKEYADVIERVTFWGYKDNTSWRSETAPLLFTSDLEPKPAYYAVLEPEKYADIDASGVGKVETKKAKAAYGTPVIDGTVDACWSNAEVNNISTCLFAWQGADGILQMMWDESYLYALVQVNDTVLNASNRNQYEQDSVEFFLDPNNCKDNSYDKDCAQVRVNYKGLASFGSIPEEVKNGFTYAAATTANGYLIEMKIPVAGLKEGKVMGFDAQINDANAAGTRVSVRKFNANSDDAYSIPAMWAEVTLVK